MSPDILTAGTGLAAGAVVLVQQILKSKLVPLKFANEHPVPTNIVLSVLASIWVANVNWSVANWKAVVLNVGTIAVTAAITYNQLVGKSHEVKATEG